MAVFALAAARLAYRDAGLEPLASDAILFATSDGGISHTKRFFAGVSRDGPGAGSPLLFPETVYNAPSSHVAAALGIEAPSQTVVTDDGLSVASDAARLLLAGFAGRVLVIAANEADRMSAAAYDYWGIGGNPCKPLGEGAVALLLGEGDGPQIRELKDYPNARSAADFARVAGDALAGAEGHVAAAISGRAAQSGWKSAAGHRDQIFRPDDVFGEAGAVCGLAAAAYFRFFPPSCGSATALSLGYAGSCSAVGLTWETATH